MLRLADLGGKVPKTTKALLRSVLPHFVLVIVVSVYLLFGAQVFYYLERPHDQHERILAKVRINKKIRHLMGLIDQEWECNVSLYDNTSQDHTTFDPQWSPASTTLEMTEVTDRVDPEQVRYQKRLEIERRIYYLLDDWEDAIGAYDIRTMHMFTHDHLIDRRWDTGNVTDEKLRATDSRWTFSASILFAFTIISTIGYGNLTPNTFWGRLFCMIYGIIGIPLTMLAIANIGRFLAEGTGMLVDRIRRERAYRRAKKQMRLQQRRKSRLAGQLFSEVIDVDLKPLPKFWGHITLFTCFVLYMIMGALCLPLWEELDFFDGCYFSFVTITTVGFGDIVPRQYDYLFPTLIYITVGLAITTLTVEIFGAFLREIHFLGSKIKGAKNALIWFGNKMLTVQDLVTAIGRHYGIPQGEIETLNEHMDDVVKETVHHKKEEKRLQKAAARRKRSMMTRRGLAPLFADYEFRYIDEESLNTSPMNKEHFILPKGNK